ncbi:MAG: sulfite exporter TauE/SafE family protein [Gammaproteobacteria bacterium]
MHVVLALALGAAVGLVLGLTGAGGAILAVPLLMWGYGWSVQQAVPVALVAVAASATAGTLAGWDARLVRYRAAALIAGVGSAAAPFGLTAAAYLPDSVLALAFAAVMLPVALRMLASSRGTARALNPATPATDSICALSEHSGRILWTRPCTVAIALTGALTGFLSGLLGVGGGFVIVPVLRAVARLSMHAAIATSLMAVALTSTAAVIAAVSQGIALPWHVALPFVGGALGGMLAGRRLAALVPAPRLQQGFAALALGVALALAIGALRRA